MAADLAAPSWHACRTQRATLPRRRHRQRGAGRRLLVAACARRSPSLRRDPHVREVSPRGGDLMRVATTARPTLSGFSCSSTRNTPSQWPRSSWFRRWNLARAPCRREPGGGLCAIARAPFRFGHCCRASANPEATTGRTSDVMVRHSGCRCPPHESRSTGARPARRNSPFRTGRERICQAINLRVPERYVFHVTRKHADQLPFPATHNPGSQRTVGRAGSCRTSWCTVGHDGGRRCNPTHDSPGSTSTASSTRAVPRSPRSGQLLGHGGQPPNPDQGVWRHPGQPDATAPPTNSTKHPEIPRRPTPRPISIPGTRRGDRPTQANRIASQRPEICWLWWIGALHASAGALMKRPLQ